MPRRPATKNVVSEMEVRELKVPGAWEITPKVHGDSRGVFFEWLTDRGFTAFAGHRLDVRQANCSVSAAGVLRGLHFAELPPSQAKYVTCVSGSVFDVVVDIRVGSPTFGQWDSVVLNDTDRRTIYISEGLAHGFLALQDNSTVMYLCSAEYNPKREHTIRATDPALGIDWPLVNGAPASLSGRDAAAPSFADVRAAGLLPTWEETQRFIAAMRSK
jgi:dTDP-4-dehydrorhamnose 3,5-epimerase